MTATISDSDTKAVSSANSVAIPRPGSGLRYYSFDKVLSYNGVFNFVIGARGLGKTYGAKKIVIRNAIRKGEQFIYTRRYKDELRISRDTFFADIQDEFPNYDFRINSSTAEMATSKTRGEKKRDWVVIGFFLPLSTAQSIKSVAFPKVTMIIFDEFIIEKGTIHYLPNEATAFTNFFSTVDRYKDKTRVLFLANSVSIMNPYFLEYDIKPDQVGEFVTKHDNFIVCHFADSKEFSKGVYRTRFGQFIEGTEYADYAAGNEFLDNHDSLLMYKNSKARYTYSLETKAGVFSVWIDWDGPFYYIQEKLPKRQDLFTIIPERMSEGKTLVGYNDKMVTLLRTAFRNGKAYFDTAKSRNAFIEIFKR
jgi:hypothetical protein